MYVGDTRDGSGARHMLWEVVANALDEHLAGRATRISVTIDPDDTLHVDDDGAGIPVHLVDGVPFPEVALTKPHRSGTLDGHAPHAHVGLHGIGIFVVNALSSELVIESFRDGGHHRHADHVPLRSR